MFAGKLLKWQLIMYGVAEEPVRLKQPRQMTLQPVVVQHSSTTAAPTASTAAASVSCASSARPFSLCVCHVLGDFPAQVDDHCVDWVM